MRACSVFSLTVLLFLSPAALAWDSDEMDLFDLVEEVNKNFYEVMGLDQASTTTKDVLMSVTQWRWLKAIMSPWTVR